jgi:hypothetical protein
LHYPAICDDFTIHRAENFFYLQARLQRLADDIGPINGLASPPAELGRLEFG